MSLTARSERDGQQEEPVADEQLLELQRDFRSAAAIAYGLRRHEQVQQRVWIADALGELEQELLRIERKLGGPQRTDVGPNSIDATVGRLASMAHDAGPVMAAQIGALIGSVRGLGLSLEVAESRLSGTVMKTG